VISVEQGEDPRDFTLVAFGGAGPLHAADVARNIGMRHVLIPLHPGLLSAIGLLYADVRSDFSLTRLLRAELASLPAINAGWVELRARGDAWLAAEHTGETSVRRTWRIDMRYAGQNSELSIKLDHDQLDPDSLARATARFHQRHHEAYGYDMPEQPVEIVTLRLVLTVPRPTLPHAGVLRSGSTVPALREHRQVWFPESGFVPTPIYDRDQLPADAKLDGPCIVEQMDTTTVVLPQARLRVDALGYLHIDVNPSREPAGKSV
jgi:N-methylhydantoinase A